MHAAVLTLAPDNEIVEVSSNVTVSIQVSELSGVQVGAYDLIVSWDSAVLSLTDRAFGVELDGPDKSFQASSPSPGTLNLAEFSFDTLTGQSEPVALKTLSVDCEEQDCVRTLWYRIRGTPKEKVREVMADKIGIGRDRQFFGEG